MIPMRQFLREHQISGEIAECAPDPRDASPLDGASFRVQLTNGRHEAFEARLHRPMGALAPTLGEGLAEIARRTSAMGPADVAAAGAVEWIEGVPDAVRLEAKNLQEFLGEEAHADLLFEFGRRPEEQVEQGDSVGNPARPDEMTNQEPGALAQAQDTTVLPRAARYLIGVPVVAAGAAGVLLSRGRRGAAVATAVAGTLATVAGVAMAGLWRRRHQRHSVRTALETMADQQTTIQTEGLSS